MTTKTLQRFLAFTLGTIILALLGVPAAEAMAVPAIMALAGVLGFAIKG